MVFAVGVFQNRFAFLVVICGSVDKGDHVYGLGQSISPMEN